MKWKNEPDEKHWTHEGSGYACHIYRVKATGALCGYVDIPSSHPLSGVDYDHLPDGVHDVHGGITYARSVDGAWRIGFDCAHCGDLMPALQFYPAVGFEEYRDMAYVTNETDRLASILAEMSS